MQPFWPPKLQTVVKYVTVTLLILLSVPCQEYSPPAVTDGTFVYAIGNVVVLV